MMMTELLMAVAIGLGATAIMDVWALLMRGLFSVASANYCLVGRWFCHMPAGTFTHVNIATASQKQGECLVGWIAHYAIGVAYALVLVIAVPGWVHHPRLLPALVIGWVTLLFPLLIMQPSFGLGIASSRAPRPTPARLRSAMAHTSFGVGLYIAAVLLSHVIIL